MNKQNIFILFLGQVLGFTTPSFIFFSAGLVGANLMDLRSLITLPVSCFVIGNALMTWGIAPTMKKLGRKRSFITVNSLTFLPSIIAYFAITQEIFIMFCLATLLFGMKIAFVNQYRFAAAENASEKHVPQAISIIFLGGVFGGFFGPFMASYFKDTVTGSEFAFSYLILFILDCLSAVAFLAYKEPTTENQSNTQVVPMSIREVLKVPNFIVAATIGACGYGFMSLLMTATPVNMKILQFYPSSDAAIVVQLHVVSMFLPSLFTGKLIEKFGPSKIIICGIILSFLIWPISRVSQDFEVFLIILILLGVAWNFMFVTATVIVQQSCTPKNKFKVQGLNESIIFFVQAFASLSAGKMLFSLGWLQLINFSMLLIVPVIIAVILYKPVKN